MNYVELALPFTFQELKKCGGGGVDGCGGGEGDTSLPNIPATNVHRFWRDKSFAWIEQMNLKSQPPEAKIKAKNRKAKAWLSMEVLIFWRRNVQFDKSISGSCYFLKFVISSPLLPPIPPSLPGYAEHWPPSLPLPLFWTGGCASGAFS